MFRPRIVPVLLMSQRGLYKTTRFVERRYLGDPLNAVRIFNEKQADEIIVLDIDAQKRGVGPDFDFIAELLEEVSMPFCYGGGVRSLDDARRLIFLGVDKIALGVSSLSRTDLISEISQEFGRQSVSAILNIGREAENPTWQVFDLRVMSFSQKCGLELARELVSAGAGEIIFNFVDLDGCMNGYAVDFASRACEIIDSQVTFLGGAGDLEDLRDLFRACGPVGAAAGSLFVYKGANRAVLINYPSLAQRYELARLIHRRWPEGLTGVA